MISDYLDRGYVLSETRAQRDWLVRLQTRVSKKDQAALAELRRHKVTPAQLKRVIAALTDALAKAKKDKKHPQGSPYIPNDPITCGLQVGLTRIAIDAGQVKVNAPATRKAPSRLRSGKPAGSTVDTSPTLRLRNRAGAPEQSRCHGTDRGCALGGGSIRCRCADLRGATRGSVWFREDRYQAFKSVEKQNQENQVTSYEKDSILTSL